ncbi:MAG TPA: pitrilysin family protein, partial [Gemmatimonadaceae bacterium]|nr:pitrilysin family protein [Gemmatimonadaceae bacterium]
DLSAIELIERVEGIGATLRADADWDSAHLSMSLLSERLPEALSILADVLTRPMFPSDELERLRNERLSELLQLRSEPRGLADESFIRAVYTDESRYSAPLGGREESVRRISRDDVLDYHRDFYAPARAAIIVAGDVQPEQLENVLTSTLGSWRGVGSAAQPRRGSAALSDRRVHVVPRADAPQSELRIGQVGLPRSHADYFPMVVMNSILGGVFSSRINLNLRERHAYTYSAHSVVHWRRGAGPFVVRTAVESGVTAASVREVMNEIQAVRTAPVQEGELSLARDYLSGVFPIRFETTGAIAAALAQLVVHELPEDYYDRYQASITAVTTADVLRVARIHLDLERMTVVAVGDPEVVREPLEKIGLGAVVVAAS